MPEQSGATELKIRGYLANHGGSVHDGGGRGLTDDMARELGVDKPAALSAVLQEMERDGVITREMRGLRTYKIALVNDDGGDGSSGPGGPQRVSLRESRGSAPAPDDAPAFSGAASQDTVVSLREALSRQSAPPVADPEPAAATAGRSGAPALANGPAGRAVSLRDALSRPAAHGDASAPAAAPPTPADAEWRRPPPPRAAPVPAPAAGRAVSLRDAIAGGVDTATPPLGWPSVESPAAYGAPSDYEAPSASQFTSLRDTARLTSFPDVRTDDDDIAPSRRPGKSKGGARIRPRLSVPVPEVKTPPSNTIIMAVGVALVGLVLVAVITTVFARGSGRQLVSEGSSSNDSCNVVTSAQAAVAFGDDAGPPNYVLNTCVYDDGTHELIIEVYRQNAQNLFNEARTGSAVTVANVGDAAYYVNGELRVLQGSAMLEITLGPVPAATPAPGLLAASRLAVVRLALPVVTG